MLTRLAHLTSALRLRQRELASPLPTGSLRILDQGVTSQRSV